MTGPRSEVTFSIWKTHEGYSPRLYVSGEGSRTQFLPAFKSREDAISHAEPIVRQLGVDTSGMSNARTKLSIHGWRGKELDMMSDPDYNPDDHIGQAQFVAKMRKLQKDAQAELDKRLPQPPQEPPQPPQEPPEPKDPADWWKESVFDREDEPGPRVTFIGGIRADDGTVKVVKDVIVDYEGWLTGMDSNFGEPTRKTHANMGMRGSKDGKPLWIKFRACEGTCFWWEQPTLDQKRQASDAVVAAGGPPVTEHMFISSTEAHDWIDRLTDRRYKPRSSAEYAWQRAHYESMATRKERAESLVKKLLRDDIDRVPPRGRDRGRSPRSGDSVTHAEFGTGTVLACNPANEQDRQYYAGDLPFVVGMKLCSVDWDDGGTTDTLVSAEELQSAPD